MLSGCKSNECATWSHLGWLVDAHKFCVIALFCQSAWDRLGRTNSSLAHHQHAHWKSQYQFMRRQLHNIRYSAGCTGINYTCTTLIMSKYRCRSRMAFTGCKDGGSYGREWWQTQGLTDSHELAMFLELYNANSWTRGTGKTVTIPVK